MAKSGNSRSILLAYFLTIVAITVASLYPDHRIWGLNWFGHLGPFIPFGTAVILSLFGLAAGRSNLFSFDNPKADLDITGSIFKSSLTLLLFLMVAGIIFLPSRTHFLGDGYQLMARLSDGVTSVKAWDYGASLVHDFIYGQLSVSTDRARLTYHLFSAVCGFVVLVSSLLYARARSGTRIDRLLLFAAIVSGGYMLIFFGYVENYAGLVSGLILFTMSGDLAARGKISTLWPILAFLLTLFFHLFGLFLVPAWLYLLFKDTSVGKLLAGWTGRSGKWAVLVALAVGIALYFYLRSTSLFFNFAFLPLIPDRFTVDNDYILSFKHLVDLINLFLILLPGVGVLLALLGHTGMKRLLVNTEGRFLVVLVVTLFLPPLLLNPGIGMPRNWDLFCLVGVPLGLLFYGAILGTESDSRYGRLAALLAILLSLSILGARVYAQYSPELGVAHFHNYVELDRTRNRNSRSLLLEYFEKQGDTARAAEYGLELVREFPEVNLNERAKQLMLQGNYAAALQTYEKVVEINPLFFEAYGNIGYCLLATNRIDSGLQVLHLADGMNPYNLNTVTNIGSAYLRLNQFDRAVDYFISAFKIDSSSTNVLGGLASAHAQAGRPDSSVNYLRRLDGHETISDQFFVQAATVYSKAGAEAETAEALKLALKNGLDSAQYLRLLNELNPTHK